MFPATKYDRYCQWCQSHVQQNSKHCGQCNRCTSDFDHHCKWLNNCIGGRNYWLFFCLIWFTMLQAVVILSLNIIFFLHRLDDYEFIAVLGYVQLSSTILSSLVSTPILLFTAYLSIYHVWLKCNKKSTYKHILEIRQR